jgi:hypothetical protein
MKIYIRFMLLGLGLGMSCPAFAQGAISELLRANDVAAIEDSLAEVQRRFERQELSEYELRNAFRPFYTLDSTSLKNLQSWAAGSPKSYVAHLALGIYYKRLGTAARGKDAIARTPRKNLDEMRRHFQVADEELRASMTLTAKPYLSIFHLLDVTGILGERRSAEELIAKASEMLPSGSLARNRHASYLKPRWGGSYAEMDRFIEHTTRQGAPTSVVQQLQAIKYNDVGFSLEERGERREAEVNFEHALRLGKEVGGNFSAEFLSTSRAFMCSGPAVRSPFCR